MVFVNDSPLGSACFKSEKGLVAVFDVLGFKGLMKLPGNTDSLAQRIVNLSDVAAR